MALTLDALTDGDFVEIDDADSIGNWTATGSMGMDAVVTGAPVEGTGLIETRIQTGIGELLVSRVSQDLEDTHIRGWLKLAQGLETVALGGARLRIGTLTNYGEWNIYGSDRQVLVYNGWMAMCVDILRPFDDVLGTPPAITAITDSGFRINWLNGNGKALDTADRLWFGNLLHIVGGVTGDRGTWSEAATDDESNGYGLIRPLGGVYFVNSVLAFGDVVGTTTTFFEDTNQVIVFEDLPVSGSLYKIQHVGNSTGTNHFQLGATSGSGVDQEGSSGGVLQAAGVAPFRIEAIDADVDAVNYYGVTMLGPASTLDDALRNVKVEDSGSSFTDITRDANFPHSAGASITSSSVANPTNILCAADHGFRSGASVVITGHTGSTPSINATHTIIVVDATNFTIPINVTVGGTGGTAVSGQASDAMPSTQEINDAIYFGHDERFYDLSIKMTVAKGGTWTGTWEYHNGSTWASLTDLTDGTANFATTGDQTIDWTIPDDWAANPIDTDTRYWVRFRISDFTSTGTTPVIGTVACAMSGDIRLEDANVDMVGCTLTGMGAIRLRSGAFLKKTTINSSNVPVKHGAVDLGSADPSANTFRDVTVQNCNTGILLKGTSTGTTEYNFRNIGLNGNTNDVRVDFPAAATITINILEGGDTPTITQGPSTDVTNVNGSTVNVVNSVTLTLTGIQTDSEVRIINLDDVINFSREIAGDEQITGSTKSVTIINGGTGYTDGDTLTVVGGTGTATQFTINETGGVIDSITAITVPGSYTVNPTNPVSTTGGTGGDDATFNLTISGEFTFNYDSVFNPNVAIIVFHLNFREVRLEQALDSASQSIPIQQNIDRTYNNP